MKLWILGALLLAGCSTAGGRVAAYCNPLMLAIGGVTDNALPYSDANPYPPNTNIVKKCRAAIDEVR